MDNATAFVVMIVVNLMFLVGFTFMLFDIKKILRNEHGFEDVADPRWKGDE